jgi:hypothetical protein
MNLYSFISIPKGEIADFEAGRIKKEDIISKFCTNEHILLDDMFEIINITLELIAPENRAVSLVGEEINILAGEDGEALLLETYTVTYKDGYGYEICEPAGYKTTEELQMCIDFLDTVSKREFEKAFSVKKILKETSFILYNPASVKKQKDIICQWTYDEMIRLRDFYRRSVEKNNYVVLISVMDDDTISIAREAAIMDGEEFNVKQERYGKWLELFNEAGFSVS